MQDLDHLLHDNYQALSQTILERAASLGASQSEVSISHDKGICVEASHGDLETFSHEVDTSLDLTVYRDHRSASVSTTDLTSDAISLCIDKAMSLLSFAEPDPFSGLAEPETMAIGYADLDQYHPCARDASQYIDQAIAMDTLMRDYDARIMPSSSAVCQYYDSLVCYANSHGFLGNYLSSHHVTVCSAIAKNGDSMQTHSDYTTACYRGGLQSDVSLVNTVCDQVLASLDAQPVTTQSCPVLFLPSVAKKLMSAFVTAVSGSLLYKKTSFLYDTIGEALFPDFITFHQRPHLPKMPGSRAFDYSGAATVEQSFVQDGRLQSYILGDYTARKLGLPPTGNSGGVFNLQMSTGAQDIDQLCCEMGRGLLVVELMGQGVNLVTGDFSKGASGFWVDNGVIQHPVSEVTIASNLRQMFQGIVAVGRDLDTRGRIHAPAVLIDEMTVAGS